MKRLLTSIFALVSSIFTIFSQTNDGLPFDIPVVLGNAFLEIGYDYTKKDHITNPDNFRDIQEKDILLIGKEFSQFQALGGMRNDSVGYSLQGKILPLSEAMKLVKNLGITPNEFYILRNHLTNDSVNFKNTISSFNGINFIVFSSEYTTSDS